METLAGAWAYPVNASIKPVTYTQTFTAPVYSSGATLRWRADGRLARAQGSGASAADRTYAYDAAGQLTCRGEGGVACPGSVPADCSGGGANLFLYRYDPRGQRLCQSAKGVVTTYAYNANGTGRLVSSTTGGSTTSYTWDDDGRRTATTGALVSSTSYDVRGLPVTVTNPGGVENRRYDGDGTLVHTDRTPAGGSNTATEFVLDPTMPNGEIITTKDPSSTVVDYYAGRRLRRDTNGTLAAPTYTWHGDAVANGTTIVDYEPFGAAQSAAGTQPTWNWYLQRGFTGEVQLSDGVHLRARTYDPGTGSFTTPDPLDGVDGTTTVANPYHYTDNNPINKTDPSGLRPVDGEFECGAKSGGSSGWSGGLPYLANTGEGGAPPPAPPATPVVAEPNFVCGPDAVPCGDATPGCTADLVARLKAAAALLPVNTDNLTFIATCYDGRYPEVSGYDGGCHEGTYIDLHTEVFVKTSVVQGGGAKLLHVVAHEVAHHFLAPFFRGGRRGDLPSDFASTLAVAPGVMSSLDPEELSADCIATAWVGHSQYEHYWRAFVGTACNDVAKGWATGLIG